MVTRLMPVPGGECVNNRRGYEIRTLVCERNSTDVYICSNHLGLYNKLHSELLSSAVQVVMYYAPPLDATKISAPRSRNSIDILK